MFETIVTKSCLAARAPVPAPAVLQATAAVFAEALAAIPTDRLGAVYTAAIQAHTSVFPLSTGELLAAWYAMQTAEPPLPVMDEAYWAQEERTRHDNPVPQRLYHRPRQFPGSGTAS